MAPADSEETGGAAFVAAACLEGFLNQLLFCLCKGGNIIKSDCLGLRIFGFRFFAEKEIRGECLLTRSFRLGSSKRPIEEDSSPHGHFPANDNPRDSPEIEVQS